MDAHQKAVAFHHKKPRYLGERYRAQELVQRSMRAGTLPRPLACEACGKPNGPSRSPKAPTLIYHHHSYAPEHWLDVIPLCLSCHRRVHGGSIPEPRTGRVYPSRGRRGVALQAA